MHAEPGTSVSSVVREDETATPSLAASAPHPGFHTTESATSSAARGAMNAAPGYDDHATQLGTRAGCRVRITSRKVGRKLSSVASAAAQAFGADRLRRCAQLSQSVALAASCAPQLPQSE